MGSFFSWGLEIPWLGTAEDTIVNTVTIVHVQHNFNYDLYCETLNSVLLPWQMFFILRCLSVILTPLVRRMYVFPSSTHPANTMNQRHTPEQGIPKPRADGRGNETGEGRGTRLEQQRE